jgi:hypothetical protein
MRFLPLAVTLLITTALLAQSQPPQPTPAEEVPPHDITKVDPAPLGGAIAVPLPEAQRRRMAKYDIPELVGARQALGSQLIKGELPKPLVDYVAKDGQVVQRLSMFEGGLTVINVSGAGAMIRKKLIIPADALKTYLKAVNIASLSRIRTTDLVLPREGREARLRVYDEGSTTRYVERLFDPVAVLPKAMTDQVLPMQDLLRAMYEDRGITNTVAGYVPAVGDQLVADDQKVYRVTRVIDDRLVELRCISQPTTIYVAVKDLYNYFIGTTGAARQ